VPHLFLLRAVDYALKPFLKVALSGRACAEVRYGAHFGLNPDNVDPEVAAFDPS
jgi:hypothetical protein